MRGEEGRSQWFGASVGGVLVRKPPELVGKRLARENSRGVFIRRERSLPNRFVKISLGGGFSASLSGSLGVFENQGAVVLELDFLGFPCGTLVESVGIGI